MLFALALVPVAGLLCFIYFNDKNTKEPFGLLVALFFAGMGTVISAIILENVGSIILEILFPYESILKTLILTLLIVGPAEELGKFVILRLITWKNKHFTYSYDAIVYAVFVSLGFAALENVNYVFNNGIGTAILRMLTAVPGHACFAVFMGFFYSKAKYASITKKTGAYVLHTILALIVPIAIHGVYDAIIMIGSNSDEFILSGIFLILWIAFVIVLFVVSVIIIIYSSRHDFCIVTIPEQQVQTVYRPNIVGSWNCTCGTVNYLNFCSQCGRQRPINTTWYCPQCGTLCTFKFCGTCGFPGPHAQSQIQR
ncbi:MAG: PrsW family intramembrane metalloprotease [Clostridiales bacterium]|nr:PrsW family intramembrane metalloprotease [Clostridiales bacterium]